MNEISSGTSPVRAREAQQAESVLRAPKAPKRLVDKPLFWVATYLLLLSALCLHLYRNPEYDMDSIQYMGNALLTGSKHITEIHSLVYAEVKKGVPEPARSHLLGKDEGAPVDQNHSRELRARDPRVFAQFLPFFAIRPLYNLSLRYVNRIGIDLLRSTVLISITAYFLTGLLLLCWIEKYVQLKLAIILAFLTMLAPPLTVAARENTSDALATFVAFASLYLIFETEALSAGLVVLLASIYFRTDFVVLAGPVILALWLEHRIRLWHGIVLSALALASALAINHFAGDYGFRMLYYRNFIGTPIEPAAMNLGFSFHDYLSAFRSGITALAGSFFFPFLLAVVGVFWSKSPFRTVACATISYSALHFIVLPNWQERWFGIFYLSSGIAMAIVLSQKAHRVRNGWPGRTDQPVAA